MRVKSGGFVADCNVIKAFKQVFAEGVGNKLKTVAEYTQNANEANGLFFSNFLGAKNIVVGGIDSSIIQDIFKKVLENDFVDLDEYAFEVVERKKDVKAGHSYILYDSMLFDDGKLEVFKTHPILGSPVSCCDFDDLDDEEDC